MFICYMGRKQQRKYGQNGWTNRTKNSLQSSCIYTLSYIVTLWQRWTTIWIWEGKGKSRTKGTRTEVLQAPRVRGSAETCISHETRFKKVHSLPNDDPYWHTTKPICYASITRACVQNFATARGAISEEIAHTMLMMTLNYLANVKFCESSFS